MHGISSINSEGCFVVDGGKKVKWTEIFYSVKQCIARLEEDRSVPLLFSILSIFF